MEASKPKGVNSILNTIGVNKLRVGDFHMIVMTVCKLSHVIRYSEYRTHEYYYITSKLQVDQNEYIGVFSLAKIPQFTFILNSMLYISIMIYTVRNFCKFVI